MVVGNRGGEGEWEGAIENDFYNPVCPARA